MEITAPSNGRIGNFIADAMKREEEQLGGEVACPKAWPQAILAAHPYLDSQGIIF